MNSIDLVLNKMAERRNVNMGPQAHFIVQC